MCREKIMSVRRVLSVGQCMADHARIAHFLRTTFGAEVVGADTAGEATQKMQHEPFDLVLVNRILDADGDSGIAWIREVQASDQLRKPAILLVSNYEDSQVEAIAAGARPGFGKAALQSPLTITLLGEYLSPKSKV